MASSRVDRSRTSTRAAAAAMIPASKAPRRNPTPVSCSWTTPARRGCRSSKGPRTSWDGTTLTYNGMPYTDGSSISLGGGHNDEPLDADCVPEGCDVDGVFYVAP